MRLRCSTCHSLLGALKPDRIVTVKCQRCRQWQSLPLDGEAGEVRCEGAHPRLDSTICHAILLKRGAPGTVLLHCRRCGEQRQFPRPRTVLLDGRGDSALGFQP